MYIGYSSDLKRRIKEHSVGKVISTKSRRPLQLVYYEAYCNENDAKAREVSFKKSGSVYNGLVKRIRNSIDDI